MLGIWGSRKAAAGRGRTSRTGLIGPPGRAPLRWDWDLLGGGSRGRRCLGSPDPEPPTSLHPSIGSEAERCAGGLAPHKGAPQTPGSLSPCEETGAGGAGRAPGVPQRPARGCGGGPSRLGGVSRAGPPIPGAGCGRGESQGPAQAGAPPGAAQSPALTQLNAGAAAPPSAGAHRPR